MPFYWTHDPTVALRDWAPLLILLFIFICIKHWDGCTDKWAGTGGSGGPGGAGCVACLQLMKGVPSVWRVAPALSLSLWRRMPVITRPLSESILGSGATWVSMEQACASFCLTTYFFFNPSFVLIYTLLFSPSSLTHICHAEVCVLNSNKLVAQSQEFNPQWLHFLFLN